MNPRWKAFNVDTGAGGTVWPTNADYACEKISGPGGRNYKTATGEKVEGQGRFRVRCQSAWGHLLQMTGEKTSVRTRTLVGRKRWLHHSERLTRAKCDRLRRCGSSFMIKESSHSGMFLPEISRQRATSLTRIFQFSLFFTKNSFSQVFCVFDCFWVLFDCFFFLFSMLIVLIVFQCSLFFLKKKVLSFFENFHCLQNCQIFQVLQLFSGFPVFQSFPDFFRFLPIFRFVGFFRLFFIFHFFSFFCFSSFFLSFFSIFLSFSHVFFLESSFFF